MSAAAPSAVWRLGRLRRARARESVLPPEPRSVLISARKSPEAQAGSIEQVDYLGGRIELRLRLPDGSSGTASLLDDGVNSLALTAGATVFVRPRPR